MSAFTALEVVAALVTAALSVSAVEELVLDAWYWARRAYRTLTTSRRDEPLTAGQLHSKGQQPLAIMVPACGEHDGITSMVDNMVSVLDYQNYHVFVGTRANDPRTGALVEQLRARYSHLHHAIAPADVQAGQSGQAGCLNAIVDAMQRLEQEHAMEFAGVVLHDSADVVHPLELKLLNYLLPRKDVIQLPVTSLARNWNDLVAGAGMDEFAEQHARDKVVRENVPGISQPVGAGTCLSRRALRALAGASPGRPFKTHCVTGDYDAAWQLSRLGLSSIFCVLPVPYPLDRSLWGGVRQTRELTLAMPMCVHQLFTRSFRVASRRKARWVVRTILQSRRRFDSQKSPAAALWMHDVKTLVMAPVEVMAFALVAVFAVIWAGQLAGWWPPLRPALFAPGGGWRRLVWFCAFAVAIRCAHRIYFTSGMYGWTHGLTAALRMAAGTVVNAMAVARAGQLLLAWRFRSKPQLPAVPSQHAPGIAQPQPDPHRKRLGELLKSWQAVDTDVLAKALKEQAQTQAPLGRILVSNGWLDEETLAEAIAYQSDLPRAQLTASLVLEHAGHVGPDFGTRYRAVYIGVDKLDHPLLAMASPLTEASLDELEAWFGVRPLQHIVRESEISIALRLLSGSRGSFAALGKSTAGVPLLGDMLIEQGLLKREVFEAAMENYRPDRHGRVGDYLVRCEVIPREVIERVVTQQSLMHAQLARAVLQD